MIDVYLGGPIFSIAVLCFITMVDLEKILVIKKIRYILFGIGQLHKKH